MPVQNEHPKDTLVASRWVGSAPTHSCRNSNDFCSGICGESECLQEKIVIQWPRPRLSWMYFIAHLTLVELTLIGEIGWKEIVDFCFEHIVLII